ncbi:unnamed protein product [Polarella glacialis]|uniref:Glutathione S-transferase C-terminal domain-containing protein n=1 Tax=Polarella glacialis TaxID=89957 RepID=A0A813KPL5_POLGL|nr:unnamed protein product [Polarella glacialis]
MEAFIKHAIAYDVEAMTMGYAADWNPVFRTLGPTQILSLVPKLEKIKEVNPDLTAVCDRKVEQNKQRVVNIFGPPNGFAKGLTSFEHACGLLETQLKAGGGPFIGGAEYSIADVLYTNMLARGNWIKPAREAVAERPLVAEYWKRMQARPSFQAAGIQASFTVPGKVKEAMVPKFKWRQSL